MGNSNLPASLISAAKAGGLRSVLAFSGWLFQVVRRTCLRLMRHSGVMGDELGSVENSLAFSTRSDVEIRLDLAAAIQSLPAHYRNAVLLRDIEKLTIDEISDTLQVSREAVEARLRRARKLRREYLSDGGLAFANH